MIVHQFGPARRACRETITTTHMGQQACSARGRVHMVLLLHAFPGLCAAAIQLQAMRFHGPANAAPMVHATAAICKVSRLHRVHACAVLPPEADDTTRTRAATPAAMGRLLSAGFGTWFFFLFVTVISTMFLPLFVPAWIFGMLFNNSQHRASDVMVQWWARISMVLSGASVTVEGQENLPPANQATIYVPNHCSFLDIFVLSSYMPRRFKYISKASIMRIPLIGWAMGFALHIPITRTDRASQLKTFKNAIEVLGAGNSILTFPEVCCHMCMLPHGRAHGGTCMRPTHFESCAAGHDFQNRSHRRFQEGALCHGGPCGRANCAHLGHRHPPLLASWLFRASGRATWYPHYHSSSHRSVGGRHASRRAASDYLRIAGVDAATAGGRCRGGCGAPLGAVEKLQVSPALRSCALRSWW